MERGISTARAEISASLHLSSSDYSRANESVAALTWPKPAQCPDLAGAIAALAERIESSELSQSVPAFKSPSGRLTGFQKKLQGTRRSWAVPSRPRR